GSPRDPQPGNAHGSRDVRVSAGIRPIASPGTTVTLGPAAAAGPLVSTAAAVGQDAQASVVIAGAPGATAGYSATDGRRPIAGGTWTATLDLSTLADSGLTATVALEDAAGNGSATATATATKKTVAPAAPAVTLPTVVNVANRRAATLTIAGEPYATASWALGDRSGTVALGPTGTATISADLSALADGTLTATVALTDRAGNGGAATSASTWKDATPPAAPTIALDARDDTGASNGDYVTSVRAPRFVVAGDATARLTVYVNGVVYTGQSLTDGTYVVTATLADAAGNVSAAATAPLSLVVAATGPTGRLTAPATTASPTV